MTPARHWAPFERVFGAYCAWALRREFHAVWVRGNLPDDGAPLLVAAQHVAWWDPLVLFHLSRAHWPRGYRYFVMMDEANLRRMRFFRWVGAYGVDRASRAGAASAVRYSLEALGARRQRVVLFPQGRQQPMDARPLAVEPGASFLAARARVPVVPLALRYEFCEERRPELFVALGQPRTITHARGAADPVAAMLTELADELREDVYRARLDRFRRLVRGPGARDPVPA